MNEVTKMLKELVEKIGMTAEEAWPYVVNHVRLTSITALVACGIFIALLIILLAVAVWHMFALKKSKIPVTEDDWCAPVVLSVVSVIMIALSVGFGICNYLPDALEPAGATIRLLLKR